MIIKNTGPLEAYQQVNTERTVKNESVATNSTQQNPAQSKTDTVNLSNEAVLRQEAHATAMDTPDIRAEKVAKLKDDVQNGTYAPNSRNTAEAIIRDTHTNRDLYI